ncbi:hypothetical protein TSAR_006360 [Trichomalopsis sarcophagae]|uniref:Uncharacterized protein n=1 Tax=Trichomalopsis sarcophagae TaxID=543379 RepID=A0A232EFD2_9HYME|nr:hypothetical protein TSAR_006360 [Trichomalopsis sarcophagae]
MYQILKKHQETTLILSTLGTRYFFSLQYLPRFLCFAELLFKFPSGKKCCAKLCQNRAKSVPNCSNLCRNCSTNMPKHENFGYLTHLRHRLAQYWNKLTQYWHTMAQFGTVLA